MAPSSRHAVRAVPAARMWSDGEKFAAMIVYAGNRHRATDDPPRVFNMPPRLLSAGEDYITGSGSGLEDLINDVRLEVMEYLSDQDLIMLSLTSKRMATCVEAASREKNANISASLNNIGPKIGAVRLQYLVWKWLGRGKFLYCNDCKKFRPTDESFWKALFEFGFPETRETTTGTKKLKLYHNQTIPSKAIVKDPRNTIQQRRQEQLLEAEERLSIVDRAIDAWLVGDGLSYTRVSKVKRSCPVHLFRFE